MMWFGEKVSGNNYNKKKKWGGGGGGGGASVRLDCHVLCGVLVLVAKKHI